VKTLALVLALVFILAAILAITGIASFSHVLGFDGTRHLKHAILYAVLAVLSLLWARMGNARPTH
jgi:predicted Co/Zn/Cd cation transporter (cation efflux family)